MPIADIPLKNWSVYLPQRRRKSTKVGESRRKTAKDDERRRKSTKVEKSTKVDESRTKDDERRRKSTKVGRKTLIGQKNAEYKYMESGWLQKYCRKKRSFCTLLLDYIVLLAIFTLEPTGWQRLSATLKDVLT
jgi:hypothetical protein